MLKYNVKFLYVWKFRKNIVTDNLYIKEKKNFKIRK